LSEEIFEIVEAGTEGAEEVEVVKVFCKRCSDYIFHTPSEAKRIESNYQSYVCSNCHTEDGRIRSLAVQDVCGVCLKPYSRTGPRMCYCPKKEIFGFKITTKNWKDVGKDPKLSRLNDEVEESKTNRMLVDKVRKVRVKPYETQLKTNELLEEMIKLLKPKPEQITPPKKYEGSVIR